MRKIRIAGIAAASVATVGIVAALNGGSKPAPKPAPAPVASVAPVTATVPAPPSCKSQVDTWLAGPGHAALDAVSADTGQIGTDASAYNMTALEADGTQLEADATTAATMPVPACIDPSGDYAGAMNAYELAGADLASGDIADATTALQEGTGFISDLTGTVNGS